MSKDSEMTLSEELAQKVATRMIDTDKNVNLNRLIEDAINEALERAAMLVDADLEASYMAPVIRALKSK